MPPPMRNRHPSEGRSDASILHADLDSFYASVEQRDDPTFRDTTAKVASQEAKPDGLLLVPPGQELAFLHPLPVRRLWGVDAKTA
jgi:nucleotidyltransferase/DNA polymerase involved in DNA repair